jgi:hypothetical protein
MHCTLQERVDVAAACAFCYSDAMNPTGFALLGTPAWSPLLQSPPLLFPARGAGRARPAGRRGAAVSATRRAAETVVPAIDVSSHQPRDLRHLIREFRPAHVITKLYLPEESIPQAHTRAQLDSAQAAGCTVGGYVWCYRSLDPAKTVRDAVGLARSCGVELPVLWLDCETYEGSTFDPGPDAAWLRAAVAQAERLGVRPGIYTGHWWVRDHFPGGAAAFADFNQLPLWLADYDGLPALNFRRPFSGFTRLHGKQYSADGLDLNVFLEECCASGSRPRTLEELERENPNIRRQVGTWQQARHEKGEDPYDYPAFRAHLRDLGAPDCGKREFVGFCPADVVRLRTDNPNLGRQLAEWQRARRLGRQDPCDFVAFRTHLRALGAPDCGGQPFTEFCRPTADEPLGRRRGATHRSSDDDDQPEPASPSRGRRVSATAGRTSRSRT